MTPNVKCYECNKQITDPAIVLINLDDREPALSAPICPDCLLDMQYRQFVHMLRTVDFGES